MPAPTHSPIPTVIVAALLVLLPGLMGWRPLLPSLILAAAAAGLTLLIAPRLSGGGWLKEAALWLLLIIAGGAWWLYPLDGQDIARIGSVAALAGLSAWYRPNRE